MQVSSKNTLDLESIFMIRWGTTVIIKEFFLLFSKYFVLLLPCNLRVLELKS